ncbi:branched-subunit amino acid transport protein AzlD [Halopolyspora algeriensis]|uniref:Branched-subunit amino acid transport protein AzlD n=1 Tax=Halopolyspora algeriensis TaxID=1500506 RepID=A0A368VQM4_9ACTN|nr:AzlD domain-containing protein [Halopolyspora algeriensis]RCW43914.1 branched-subunit amino acid transport protein AzlD [Halopolyspora algeriensis]TQM53583.1 branched-subunit amino acid transport protein AzlD [Halopolyspora algeriensis]
MTLGVVLMLAAGTYALRAAGPLLRGRVRLSERWERLLSIAAITLLGAFVVTSALIESGDFAGWARVSGVAVGGVLAWCRAPFVVVVLAAAATTGCLRLLLPG